MSRSLVHFSLSVLPDTFEADVRGAYLWVVSSTILQFPVRAPSLSWAEYLTWWYTCRYVTWIRSDSLCVCVCVCGWGELQCTSTLFQAKYEIKVYLKEKIDLADFVTAIYAHLMLFSPTQWLSCDVVGHYSLNLFCLLLLHILQFNCSKM